MWYVMMKLQFVCLLLLLGVSAAVGDDIRHISGFLGGNVTLPSGADPSWTLTAIEWSILKNFTWIATYSGGKKNTEQFHLFKHRLGLDITTGDLTIYGLTKEDSMEYSVDFAGSPKQEGSTKIKLTVNQRLQQPTVTVISKALVEGGCWVVLGCSSADTGVGFSWQVTPPWEISNGFEAGGKSTVHAFLNSTHGDARVTCTSRRDNRNSSRDITPKCEDIIPEPSPCPPCSTQSINCHHALLFFIGVFVTIFITVILYFCREQIKAKWIALKEKV